MMRNQTAFVWCYVALLAVVPCLNAMLPAQELPAASADSTPADETLAKPRSESSPRGVAYDITEVVYGMTGLPSGGHAPRYASLARQWKQASTEKERAQVEAALSNVLKKQFDADLQKRRGQLQQVQRRVARLAEQLEQRRNSRHEIVDLQLKSITMGWKGLGWNDGYDYTSVEISVDHGGLDSPSDPERSALSSLSDSTLDTFVGATSDRPGSQKWSQPEAIAATKEALRRDPTRVNNRIWDEVERIAYKNATNDSTRAMILDAIAHLLHDMGRLDEALKAQEKCLELDPDDESHASFLRQLRAEAGLATQP